MAGLLTEAWATLVSELDNVGLPVSDNPEAQPLPGLIVEPPSSAAPAEAGGGWEVESTVWLVHPAPWNRRAWQWLTDHADLIDEQVRGRCEFTRDIYTHPEGDCPAYRITVTQYV
jgi:hypothetical protein